MKNNMALAEDYSESNCYLLAVNRSGFGQNI